jgi:hypothetical protein
MARTFNRPPVQVNTPSGNDVKNYFFNHYNWKGLTDNKNVLAVDQETFSDCKNVYIDAEGLLRSRPSLKVKVVKYTNSGKEYVLSNIVNVWTFGYITVYQTCTEGSYFLTFINKNYADNTLQVNTTNNIKLISEDAKIFVFSDESFNYYDILSNEYFDASKFVYIPTTSVVVNGMTSQSAKAEEENELTASYYTKYLYDLTLGNYSFSNFVGKSVKVTFDNKTYDITFEKNNELTFIGRYFPLTKENFSNKMTYGENDEGIPLVSISNRGSIILSSYELSDDGYVYKYYYSSDNILFESIPILKGAICPAVITKDGNNAISFLADGPYIYSLTKYKFSNTLNENVKEFSEWRNLLEYLNNDKYKSLGLNIYGNIVSCDFYNSTDFVFSFYDLDGNRFSSIIGIDNDFFNETIYQRNFSSSSTSSDILLNPSISQSQTLDGGRTLFNKYDTQQVTITFKDFNVNVTVDISTEKYKSSGTVRYYLTLKVQKGDEVLSFSYRDLLDSFDISENNKLVFNNDYFSTYLYGTLDDMRIVLHPNEIDYVNISVEPNTINYSTNKSHVSKYLLKRNGDTLVYDAIVLFQCKSVNSLDNSITFNTVIKRFTNDSSQIIYNESAAEDFTYSLLKCCDVSFDGDKILFAKGYENLVVKTISTDKSTLTSVLIESNVKSCKISSVTNYIACNLGIFPYLSYEQNSSGEALVTFPSGLNVNPLLYNTVLYCYDDEYIYKPANNVEILEKTSKPNVNIYPSNYSKLSSYYFSVENKLYISSNKTDEDGNFMWYFPKINTESFDFNITNLHKISDTDMAIFFNDSVSYVRWDNDLLAYRYYESKLQTGCKNGSDVLTTFDGKYTIFTSSRGLVAMSYQDYIASTEQSLTYLSDTIYSIFENYITDSKSSNQVKLFKFGYWIVIYKQDSNKGFIFDIRNNSWWPVSGIDNSVKFVNIDDSVKLLSNGKIYELNKLDTNYFDYDGKKRTKIDWFVKSQKLHLSALNNYKHISNITFVSVHDSNILQNTEYNINELDFRLQVNCYRKKVNGNINEQDDFVNVNYKVETIRTFVQRLNYSKVNEFQYQLSSDEENAIEIPLSLNSITIKYKIGGQVR